ACEVCCRAARREVREREAPPSDLNRPPSDLRCCTGRVRLRSVLHRRRRAYSPDAAPAIFLFWPSWLLFRSYDNSLTGRYHAGTSRSPAGKQPVTRSGTRAVSFTWLPDSSFFPTHLSRPPFAVAPPPWSPPPRVGEISRDIQSDTGVRGMYRTLQTA